VLAGFVMALWLVPGCDAPRPAPAAPSPPSPTIQPGPPAPPAANRVSIEVTGTVSDEHGVAMPNAVVTMGLYGIGARNWPLVQTDASGRYSIAFEAVPFGNGFVARAQVVADGYEEYWRNLRSSGAAILVQNFRLKPITRITAGESIVLTVDPDQGDCRGWVAAVCAPVRLAIPAAGRLTIEVVGVETTAEPPRLEVCCESGDERYGNPITLSVAPGPDLQLMIGLGTGISTARSFRVTTLFERF
jgi:hypothetical protein